MASLSTTAVLTTMATVDSTLHVVLFPFMTKGHTIPLIHLAHLLSHRGVSLTIFTTPTNTPFIRCSLGDTVATIIELPFDFAKPQVPTGVSSSDKVSSINALISASIQLQAHFEEALQTLPSVNFIISDAFLQWTLESASKFNIPRLTFYGMSIYAQAIYGCVARFGLHIGKETDDGMNFSLPCFPWIRLTRRDLGPLFEEMEAGGDTLNVILQTDKCTSDSQGLIVNSFYEIESAYAYYWNKEIGPRSWHVGPLCMAHQRAQLLNNDNAACKQWLNERLAMERPVVYVSFGTQAEVPEVQLQEIAVGLEQSGVDFLWVLRWKEADLGHGFEQKIAERGLVIRDWVEQVEILEHESVTGFMSHCGWNSVSESICAKVPILAWPMLAEQHINAKMIEEMGIGVRVPAETGEHAPLVRSDMVQKIVRELIVGEKGKTLREKANEVGEAAKKAMGVGGSSYNTIDLLIEEFCKRK